MTRIAQISDTHLSPGKPYFAPNWAPLAAWVAAQAPDLVIHTGDVTLDGAAVEEDMRDCAALLATLPAPVLALPGNHDVGQVGHPRQPVTPERLARWRRHFGPDRWTRDLPGWRLVGLDSMLLGTGLPEEGEQDSWLEDALAAAGGRRVALFTHVPLFTDDPGETGGYWSVPAAPRRRVLDALDRHGVALIATGHLHRSHEAVLDGRRYVWGPASSFLVGPPYSPPKGGEARLGAVLYDFDEEGVTVTRADVPGLTPFLIDDMPEVYAAG